MYLLSMQIFSQMSYTISLFLCLDVCLLEYYTKFALNYKPVSRIFRFLLKKNKYKKSYSASFWYWIIIPKCTKNMKIFLYGVPKARTLESEEKVYQNVWKCKEKISSNNN